MDYCILRGLLASIILDILEVSCQNIVWVADMLVSQSDVSIEQAFRAYGQLCKESPTFATTTKHILFADMRNLIRGRRETRTKAVDKMCKWWVGDKLSEVHLTQLKQIVVPNYSLSPIFYLKAGSIIHQEFGPQLMKKVAERYKYDNCCIFIPGRIISIHTVVGCTPDGVWVPDIYQYETLVASDVCEINTEQAVKYAPKIVFEIKTLLSKKAEITTHNITKLQTCSVSEAAAIACTAMTTAGWLTTEQILKCRQKPYKINKTDRTFMVTNNKRSKWNEYKPRRIWIGLVNNFREIKLGEWCDNTLCINPENHLFQQLLEQTYHLQPYNKDIIPIMLFVLVDKHAVPVMILAFDVCFTQKHYNIYEEGVSAILKEHLAEYPRPPPLEIKRDEHIAH